ncbi:MAG: aspartate--tRNA ligase, partial [Alphaproteobacteria bacterium]|nr:aspartate--tRNA ligase [Alphaproteobacteria bacterium]
EVFRNSGFGAFANEIANGAKVRSINVPGCTKEPRSFFDKLNDWAKELGLPGMGYISLTTEGEYKGPIVKFMTESELEEIARINKSMSGDVVFFICDKNAATLAGAVRTKLANLLNLIEPKTYKFCWVVDFPMFEYDEELKQIVFSHNPFSMPQGGLQVLANTDPLKIKAYQYDIVCNGIELSSGAIRNHVPEIMYKAFEIAGYGREVVDNKFRAMIKAFKYGAPPHGGCAPGIDRMVMLLANTENIREVIAFPFNQKAEDLMMGSPAEVTPQQLRELHISVLPKVKKTN